MAKNASYQGYATFVGEKNGRKKRRAKKLLLEQYRATHGDFEVINLNQLPLELEKGFAKNPKNGKQN